MNYPKNFEHKVDFSQIKNHIIEFCLSSMGEFFVHKIQFSSNKIVVEKILKQSSEFVDIISIGKQFPSNDFIDLRSSFTHLKTPGSYIEQEILFDLKASLTTIKNILDYFNDTEEKAYPELKKLVNEVFFPSNLLLLAEKIIDDKGEIRDNASGELKNIRQSIISKTRQVFRETKKAFEHAKKIGSVPENAEITIRNGRSVIPLLAAAKRSIGGVIHDESSTGQTVFVEPPLSFEVNNQIKELENEERREIIKILINFTNELRPYIYELTGAYRFMGLMDFIRAKALFAIKINAHKPLITSSGETDIQKAVHPILYLSHKQQDKEVVPLDINLSGENRMLIISGPNAGGKSICLKTIGLLQYMLQCGLLISASPNSTFRLYKNIFIDIGDDQSLENDLSTYSSHLLNMKYFLQNANSNTLILIDEFGTGTEPQLGGAIAEATLEQLNKKNTYGVITTHYTNLKIAAERLPGLINGAMLFDSKEMRPLYKLQIGKPGSSFAFEIAKKIGFPNNVIVNAKNKSGGKHVKFDQQLQQLEIDKIKLQKNLQKAELADANLSKMVEKYSDLVNELEKSKKQIVIEANNKALSIIEESNKAVEKTIREIKEAGADKEKTREIRKALENKKEKLKNEPTVIHPLKKKHSSKHKKPHLEEDLTTNKPINIGDYVKISGSEIIGELVKIDGKDVTIVSNDIKIKSTITKLVRVVAPKKKNRRRKGYNDIINELNEKTANFSLNIDLRGTRADEAMMLLQKYIDEAILLSMREVSILHGKGDGILRKIIREYLGSVNEVTDFGDAPLEMGGSGITKVYLQ